MTEANKPFEFDEDIHEISFAATTRKGETRTVHHRLRKPTLEELNERESQIKYETIKINPKEIEVRNDQRTADANLWGKIVQAVKGYKDADDWRELSDEEKSKFNGSHKSQAIQGLYAGQSKIEGDGDYVPIGPVEWTVRQEIGPNEEPDFVVRHILREPTEDERLRYNRIASSTRYVTGAKKEQAQVRTNLKAHIEVYNALIQNIKGATVAGMEFEISDRKQFLDAIDPIWKRDVIQCLMTNLEAQISD
ncbi:MAG TPA: hypothetical protein VI479_07030 [Blastocatellia bacterium]